MRSPGGEISPTGRSVEFELCEVYQIRNGRIHSARTYFDAANLMRQLGALPEPERTSSTEETSPIRAGEVPPRTEPIGAPPEREEDDRGLLERARDELFGREKEEPRREESGGRRAAPRGPGGDEPLRGR